MKQVTEKTEALVVNAHGGLVLLGMKVRLNQSLNVVNLKTGDDRLSHVTSLGPSFLGKTEVGIEFLKAAPDFWGVTPTSKV